MIISEKIKNWLNDNKAQVEPTSDLANGDYTSNLAIVTKQDANILRAKLEQNKLPEIAKIETAGPGFLNFHLADSFLQNNLGEILNKQEKFGWSEKLKSQKIIVEYTDPNPFKEFHIGHLMSNAIGESISRLIEASGAEVKRACYQGDVGLHVAKALYAGGDYALGSKQYEESEEAKQAITEINKKIYEKSDEELNQKYETGKKASLDKFEVIYQKLGTKFDYYFFESGMLDLGKKIVQENLGRIFEESEGAIVFRGEKFDPKLHTRVYITAQGLPTYETKELGLHFTKAQVFPNDLSIVITANEQDGVFRVGLEALKQIDAALAARTKHLSHGMLRLPSGKMSSRTGDVITVESLISQVKSKVLAKMEENPDDQTAEQIAVAALKFAILRQAPGRDIIFDLDKSLSLEGDSGPYLQYTYARARSVVEKSGQTPDTGNLENNETTRLLARYPDIVSRSAANFAPQLLVQYLLQLAGSFNSFYAQNKIIGHEMEQSRLALTAAVAQVIKNGLWLLGIAAPEKM